MDLRTGPHELARWAIRRPRLAIALLVGVVLAAAPGLLRLEIRTDGHALVPEDDPVVAVDAEIRQHFGLADPVVVLIETSHPDGIFNTATLDSVQQISDALAALVGVEAEDVTSLATEHRDRVYTGTMNFRPYLDPLPDSPELLEILRSDIEAAGILTGTLLSADAGAVSILVEVPDDQERIDFYRRVRAVTAPFESETDRILVVGAPVAEALLGTHIFEDLAVLLPLALTVIALVVLAGCRRLWGVALAFMEVGACLVATFGLMGWLGFPVYLTTAVLPVILTTIGLADEIHIFWHYQRLLSGTGEVEAGAAEAGTKSVVEATMDEMSRPVVLSSITTSLAFLSFLASPIGAVWSFGLFAAFGTLFCMLWSLTVIPACLALLPAAAMRRPQRSSPDGSQSSTRRADPGRLTRLVAPLIERRRLTLAVLLTLSIGLGLGVRRLYVQDSWIDGFAEGSEFRRATERANELLHGTHTLLVHMSFDPPADAVVEDEARVPSHYRTPPKGPLLLPKILEAIGELEDFVRRRPEVGGVLGTHSHLTTVAYLWLGRREGTRSIPGDYQKVERVLERFDRGRGEHRRREVVDDDFKRTVVTIYLEEANYRDTAALMAAVRAWSDENLSRFGVRLDFAGDVAVSQAMIPAIVKTQVSSLLLALAGALLALSLIYRSPVTGLVVVLPTCVAVLWVFGLMGWLRIPLGVATSMFCAITLGIGVDYSIHLVERFRRARRAGEEAPVLRAVEEAGPAIVADTLAIALGFGLLMVSQVPANARLGMLVAVALIAASVLTLAGLASLLAARKRPRPTD